MGNLGTRYWVQQMNKAEFQYGDIVTIGEHGEVHWGFMSMTFDNQYAFLESGMTGRLRLENVNNIKHWKS